ncbi:unnamed protein product, partial [Heterosigma akashiwo]
MEQPEGGFRDPEFPDHVWKLKKSLYGLKQSPRCWFANLHSTLREYGFTRSEYDGCIYMRKVSDAVTYVTIYVDDILLRQSWQSAEAFRTEKKYRITTDAGKLENFLGLKINRNLGEKTIHISQSQFIKDALIKFGYDHCPPAKTPMDPTMDLSVNKDYQASADDINRFRSMVGTLSWIATCSMPEISFAVHNKKLQRATNYPEAKHFAAAGRVFKHLKGSGNKSIKLGGGTILRAYCDANFCRDRIDGKSVTGYIVFLGDSLVAWTSRLQ